MNKPLVVVLVTVGLDAVGIGLILPILPGLVRELARTDRIAGHYGVLVASYALMQFLFSPVLGALSDRFGRRPVLLVSLAGAAVDYAVMALTPTLAVVYVGRLVAGVTGANMAVATAYIADITPEGQRANRYGLMHAWFGLGFVAGPALGGLVGQLSPRCPFLLAAALNGLSFVAAWLVLPEPRPASAARTAVRDAKPFSPLRSVGTMRAVLPLLPICLVMEFVGQVPATLWVIYGEDRFGWDVATVGLSLTAFGLLRALSQAFVTGPVTRRLGEHWTVVLGVVLDAGGLVVLALAARGWVAFAAIPLLCLGCVATPALQSLLSRRVEGDRQGELQGTLVSMMNLVGVLGPLAATGVYGATLSTRPGFVWVCAAALYLLCGPALWRLRRRPPPAPSPQ